MADARTDDYVTNGAWVRLLGRPDAIDEIADAVERPGSRWTTPAVTAPSLPVDTSSSGAAAASRWPRRSGGWRSAGLLHAPSVEERLHG